MLKKIEAVAKWLSNEYNIVSCIKKSVYFADY